MTDQACVFCFELIDLLRLKVIIVLAVANMIAALNDLAPIEGGFLVGKVLKDPPHFIFLIVELFEDVLNLSIQVFDLLVKSFLSGENEIGEDDMIDR
jgi:hypothetical protein